MSARPRLRLMPVVMIAAGALLSLKAAELATHSSYLFAPARAEDRPAEIAKAVDEKPAERAAAGQESRPESVGRPKLQEAPAPAASQPVDASPSERALLEALQKRREALDERSGELDLRENLLKAAEKRLEERLEELKKVELSVADVDRKRADEEKARLKGLVTLYEGMKPKEAAAIFERLDSGVLLDVAALMKPQKLSDVMGRMSPEVAQKLTVALARRDAPPPAQAALAELPKIEGRPQSP